MLKSCLVATMIFGGEFILILEIYSGTYSSLGIYSRKYCIQFYFPMIKRCKPHGMA